MDDINEVRDGDPCLVTRGVHAGKAGTVRDRHVSKTGHATITVQQENGERFKTLARNAARVP
jgi:ribosomal protein S4E